MLLHGMNGNGAPSYSKINKSFFVTEWCYVHKNAIHFSFDEKTTNGSELNGVNTDKFTIMNYSIYNLAVRMNKNWIPYC